MRGFLRWYQYRERSLIKVNLLATADRVIVSAARGAASVTNPRQLSSARGRAINGYSLALHNLCQLGLGLYESFEEESHNAG